MKRFINKYTDNIHAVSSCFDRIIFKGHHLMSWSENMERFLTRNGYLIKDFGKVAEKLSVKLKDFAKSHAERAGRPYIYLKSAVCKEEFVSEIAMQNNITEGLICVLSAVEGCQSFKVVPGKKRPRIVNAARKCLCLYFYFIDPDFGLMHVRIQSWLPFTIQVCINGHEWLANQMRARGIDFVKVDNCFVQISDPEKAQQLSDHFQRLDWVSTLNNFASQVNPLLDTEFKGEYYWVVSQAEYATDILFENNTNLKDLYKKLLEHSILYFSAEDVMTFLGKKFNGAFKGDQINSMKKRQPGARVKHWVKNNWMKMYNKAGSVLRVETVINNPYEFKILRHGIRNGEKFYGWYPMAKRVGNLYRYAEICCTANGRYLDAISIEPDPRPAKEAMKKISATVRSKGRGYGGFNPAKESDINIMSAVLSGEHMLFGFTNKVIRIKLFGDTANRKQQRRDAAKISRIFKRLRLRGLIAKVPRTRKWRVTENGCRIMKTAIRFYHKDFPEIIEYQAA